MKRYALLAVGIAFLVSVRCLPARADIVLAAVQDGPLNAVAMFTPTLGFINQVTTDGPILGLTSGVSNDFYVAVGNHTDHYSDSGTLLGTITASPTTLTPALSFQTATSVPEPSSLSLAAIGAIGFGCWRCRRRTA